MDRDAVDRRSFALSFVSLCTCRSIGFDVLIRCAVSVVGKMDWSGRELVALIGGGHTFGKAHSASMASNGDPPVKCPFAPWDGPKGLE